MRFVFSGFLTLIILSLLTNSSQAINGLGDIQYIPPHTYPSRIEVLEQNISLHIPAEVRDLWYLREGESEIIRHTGWNGILPLYDGIYLNGSFQDKMINYTISFSVSSTDNLADVILGIGFFTLLNSSDSTIEGSSFGFGQQYMYNGSVMNNTPYVLSGRFNVSWVFGSPLNNTHRIMHNSYSYLGYSKYTSEYNASQETFIAVQAYNYNTSIPWNKTLEIQASISSYHDPLFYEFLQQPNINITNSLSSELTSEPFSEVSDQSFEISSPTVLLPVCLGIIATNVINQLRKYNQVSHLQDNI